MVAYKSMFYRIEFRNDEIYEVLNGVELPESTPPNSFIVSSIFSSYSDFIDWKLFAHFGYDRKYPLFLVDSSQRVLPLYMPDTILGYSLLKPVGSWLFKAELAAHLLQLDIPVTAYRYTEINPVYNIVPPQRNRYSEYTWQW